MRKTLFYPKIIYYSKNDAGEKWPEESREYFMRFSIHKHIIWTAMAYGCGDSPTASSHWQCPRLQQKIPIIEIESEFRKYVTLFQGITLF